MSKPPRAGQLFLGLTFWVSHRIPGRSELIKTLEHHGGTVVRKETDTSLNLINPEKTFSIPFACHDYKFVLESIKQQRLLDESQYEIRGRNPANRIAGSISTAPKNTRTPFTAADDQILYNWLEPFRQANGTIRGNTIYEQLARVHPHHTYQSWRDRYLKFVMDRKNMRVTEVIDHGSPLNGMNIERPTKRRRINGNSKLHQAQDNVQDAVIESIKEQPSRKLHRSISLERSPCNRIEGSRQKRKLRGQSPHEHAEGRQGSDEVNDQSVFCTPERDIVPIIDDHNSFADVEAEGRALTHQELPQERFKQTSIGGQGFDYHEASRLYAAVLAICNTPLEELESCWSNMAEHWNKHTAAQWEMYYTHHILPEYKRANNINTQEELEAHVDEAMAYENGSLPSEESRLSIASETGDLTNGPYQDQREVLKDLHGPEFAQAADKAQLQGDSIHETDHQASSDLASKSSAAQRVAITANEGRKRATQQIDKNGTHSVPADPVVPSPSPKKRLFGHRLELTETKLRASSSLAIETEATGAQSNFTSSLAVQSTISSTGKTNATSSSTSIPTAHKPPQSFQLPPKSLSTSQESANYETALQTQGLSTISPEDIGILPEHPVDDVIDDVVDLLGNGEKELEPDPIENALSDTGSEYMAFETGFERSQLWDADTRLEDERTEPSDDEISIDEPKILIRRATPLPHRSPSIAEHTDSVEDDDDDEGSAGAIENGTAAYAIQHESTRLETQALFQQSMQHEASIFDIPDPDGGWESLGIFDDPDEAIETVESPDNQSLKQRQSRSLSGMNGSLGEPDNVQESPVVAAPAAEVMDVLSDAVEQPQTTKVTPDVPQVQVKEERDGVPEQTYEARGHAPSSMISNMRLSTDSNAEQDLSILSTSRFGEAGTLPLWLTMQQEKYPDLPEMVLKRLASIASQSVNMSSLATATLLLQRLVDAFHTRENNRQAEYRQRNPGTRKRLKPTFCLSSADAKALIPKDIPGVWTPEDDDKLYEKTHASIVHNENKHGVEGVKQRIRFLASRYDLELNNGSQQHLAKTAAVSSNKRR